MLPRRHIHSIKIKARSLLANNDRISIGGRVFVFNNVTVETEICPVEANLLAPTQAISILDPLGSKRSVIKKELFGQLSMLQTNGAQGAIVKIRGELIIGR